MGRKPKEDDGRSRFGNVEELPSGKWRARYKVDGAGKSKTHDTKTAALNWLDDERSKIRRGESYNLADGKKPFEEVAEEFMEAHAHVTKGTKSDYRYILDADLIPYFEGEAIAEIDAKDVRKWAAFFGATHAPGTVKKHKNVLSALCNFAIEERYRTGNPCEFVRIRRSEDREEMIFLSHAEVLRLVAALPGEYGLAAKLAAYTGLRAGELWDLKVKSLQPSKNRIMVVSNVREIPGVGLVSRPCPKNGSWRSATVPQKLMVELARHVTENGRRGDDFVFLSPMGFQVRHNTWRSRVWGDTITKLNLEFKKSEGKSGIDKKPRPHDLRHTCAAFHFERGATGEEVRRVLGHSSITTTHRHYAHIFPEAFDRMAEGLDAEIEAAEREFEESKKIVPLREAQ